MKKRYEDALGRTLTHERYIENTPSHLEETIEDINLIKNGMKNCKSRLKEIPLKQDLLSTVEHINLMI